MAIAAVAPGRAGEKVRFDSPSEAYRQGMGAYHAELYDLAVAALEYAATNGVLVAQLRLAKMYEAGKGVPQSDAKAFHYYQLIADRHAETSPRHSFAPYVAEAFVAVAGFYRKGLEELSLKPDLAHAAGLLRHAASYFGDPTAQFTLARMYLDGEGVPKNVRLAVSWLVNASKKQHAPSQAVLGDLLWRGEQPIRKRPLKGLALLTLARINAAGLDESGWIDALYKLAMAEAGPDERARAREIVARWRRQLQAVDSKDGASASGHGASGGASAPLDTADVPAAARAKSATGPR